MMHFVNDDEKERQGQQGTDLTLFFDQLNVSIAFGYCIPNIAFYSFQIRHCCSDSPGLTIAGKGHNNRQPGFSN